MTTSSTGLPVRSWIVDSVDDDEEFGERTPGQRPVRRPVEGGTILGFATDDRARGQGIGSALLGAVFALAHQLAD